MFLHSELLIVNEATQWRNSQSLSRENEPTAMLIFCVNSYRADLWHWLKWIAKKMTWRVCLCYSVNTNTRKVLHCPILLRFNVIRENLEVELPRWLQMEYKWMQHTYAPSSPFKSKSRLMINYESRIVTRESIESLQVALRLHLIFEKKRNPTEEIDLGISALFLSWFWK